MEMMVMRTKPEGQEESLMPQRLDVSGFIRASTFRRPYL